MRGQSVDVHFEQPLSFSLRVVEVDDHLPSMRVEADVSVSQFSHNVTYQGSFWIRCADWDRFVAELGESLEDGAVLSAMDGSFLLKIWDEGGRRVFEWAFRNTDLSQRVLTAGFIAEVDSDAFAKLKEEFVGFPRWW
jgi:hypothetical protein